MAETKPGIADVKRLFASSGDRCAFPQCTAPIAFGGTIVGEVCHIKGEKPGSARHDSKQTNAERHAYENLILMCANHHRVIDDDVETYTVERLYEIKNKHEANSAELPDAEVSQFVQLFVDQLVSVTGQTGGVSAHTIHAKTINVQPSAADAVTQQRRVQAIDALWKIVRSCRNEFSDIIFVDTILTKQEIENYFKNGWDNRFFGIKEFASPNKIGEKFNNAKAHDAENERPFVSHRLYVIVFTIRAMLGRVALLFQNSFDEKRYNDWRTDSGMDQLLRCVLPANVVEEIKKEQAFGLQRAIDHLENEFVTEAQLNGERIQFDAQ